MKPSIFQLIDLDRTLFDTSKFAKAITDEINKTNPGLGTELDRQFEAAYKREETFFLLRHVRQSQGDAWFEALVERVVSEQGAASFLLPGATERLALAETLSTERPGWGILTFGDEIDQLMKLRIIGLEDAPVYITLTASKAEVIRSWKREDGRFQLPSAYGDRVVDILTLEDDKIRAFQNLPNGVTGLWVMTPGKEVNESDTADMNSVIVVQNLYESIQYLEQRFLKTQ